MSAQLSQLIDSTITIGTIPTTLGEIQSAMADPEVKVEQLAAIIMQDAAIASKMLKLVNGPLCGLRTPVKGIEAACTVLGFRAIRDLVLQATLLEVLGDGPAIEGFDPSWLWDHSFRSALAARRLCEACPDFAKLTPPEAYTCGLLHDLGKIVLLQSCHEQFAEALRISRDRNLPLTQAEIEVFGFSAAQVFIRLARRWRLGVDLWVSAMRDLDREQEPAHWAKAMLVHAASSIAHEVVSGGWLPEPLGDGVFETMGLASEDLQAIREAVGASRTGLVSS